MSEKEVLISTIEASHREFMAVLSQLAPETVDTPNLLGWWSARQILAHLIGWQEKAIEVIEGLRDGHEVDTPDEDDPFNAANVATRADHTWQQLTGAINASTGKLVTLAKNLPDELWQDGRTGWFTGSTINHYRIHQPDFERALTR